MRNNGNPSFADLKSAARNRWFDILTNAGISVDYLQNKHGPCPGCGGKDRFRFDDRGGDGTYFCSQGGGEPIAGDGFNLLEHGAGMSQKEAVSHVAQCVDLTPVRACVASALQRHSIAEESPRTTDHSGVADDKQRQKLLTVWNAAQPLDGHDPASLYLQARGLRRDPCPSALRLHPALPYWVTANKPACLGHHPALMARIQNISGQGVGLHRIYLDANGGKLALTDPNDGSALPAKKAMPAIYPGALNGAAVRLDEPEQGQLMLAEGIETALAAGRLSGWPVWACISANGLKQVCLPPSVVQVAIAADRDISGTGQRVAETLAARLVAEGREVRILLPEQDGRDWADVALEVAHEQR